MTYVVVGASAGLGRALAESLAARRHDLVLVASDARDLEAEAAHLRLTYSVRITAVEVDLAESDAAVAEIVTAAATLSTIDGILFAIGYSSDDDRGLLGGPELRRVLAVNLESVLALSGAFLPGLIERGRGSIVGFGSVAAARGRARNAAYAAAKRGLRSYYESLHCLTHGTGVEVQFYELGYVATQQAFGRRLFPPPSSPKAVAEFVVRGLGRGSRMTYFPRYWHQLALAVRLVPQRLFCRLEL